MRSIRRFTLAVVLAALLFACNGPTEPDVHSFQYPLVVGNLWVYDYTEIAVYSDSTPPDTIRYTVTATVSRADTILPGIVACLIQQSGIDNHGALISGCKSYVNMPDGMYAYYRYQPGAVLPKPGASGNAALPDMRKLRGAALPIHLPLFGDGTLAADYYKPAPLILPYPQQVGYSWLVGDTARYLEGGLWLDKQITGWESVTTPAGTFEGVNIKWIYHWPYETVEESCVMSPQGMVLRTANYFDIDVTDYSFPYGTGETMDVYMQYELVSYTLH